MGAPEMHSIDEWMQHDKFYTLGHLLRISGLGEDEIKTRLFVLETQGLAAEAEIGGEVHYRLLRDHQEAGEGTTEGPRNAGGAAGGSPESTGSQDGGGSPPDAVPPGEAVDEAAGEAVRHAEPAGHDEAHDQANRLNFDDAGKAALLQAPRVGDGGVLAGLAEIKRLRERAHALGNEAAAYRLVLHAVMERLGVAHPEGTLVALDAALGRKRTTGFVVRNAWGGWSFHPRSRHANREPKEDALELVEAGGQVLVVEVVGRATMNPPCAVWTDGEALS